MGNANCSTTYKAWLNYFNLKCFSFSQMSLIQMGEPETGDSGEQERFVKVEPLADFPSNYNGNLTVICANSNEAGNNKIFIIKSS